MSHSGPGIFIFVDNESQTLTFFHTEQVGVWWRLLPTVEGSFGAAVVMAANKFHYY